MLKNRKELKNKEELAMLKNKKELLDVIRQYFTVKLTDKVRVYNLYIADQLVGNLALLPNLDLVTEGDKIKHGYIFKHLDIKYGFTAIFEANFNYEGKDHIVYLVSGGENELKKLKKKAKQFYDYCLLNRASSSYLEEGN